MEPLLYNIGDRNKIYIHNLGCIYIFMGEILEVIMWTEV